MELQGRVAMSNIEIGYNAVAAPADANGPLGETVRQSWGVFVMGLDAILRLVIFLLPWALLATAIGLSARTIRRRLTARAETAPIEDSAHLA